LFLHGCNYPWSTDGTTVYYGLDFGANVWGSHLGVSTRRAAVERDFEDMAALGFTIARWFLFCDGRAGIVYDERGLPEGPDPLLFADLDAALEIARGVGIKLDLVLLDHRWMFEGVRETVADPVTGERFEAQLPEGRSAVLLSPSGRQALLDRLLVPLVRRYAQGGERADLSSSVAAYELMNEPDFVVEEWERDLSRRVSRPLPFAALAELVAGLSEAVHAYSTARATLGVARLHNLWAWDDDSLGLDVLQLHSYPDTRLPYRDVDVFGIAASALGVRRGVILGEFPGNGPAQHPKGASPPPTTLDQYLEFGVTAGYQGAWPWSYSGTDAYGRLPAEPLREFARRYPGLTNPRAARTHL
jgi:hypothetical protein